VVTGVGVSNRPRKDKGAVWDLRREGRKKVKANLKEGKHRKNEGAMIRRTIC